MIIKRLLHTALILGALLSLTSGIALAQQSPVAGTVTSAGDGSVSLNDGTSFQLNDQTLIIRVTPAAVADLVPGEFVAITAQRGPNGTLQASIISAFPEELRGIGEGQRPMDDANLMTNATIDDAHLDIVNGGELTISYLGTPDQVAVNPNTRIEVFSLGSASDVVPGTSVRGSVRDGVASFLMVN